MWPDLGISGAEKVASPSTWMPGATADSIVSQFTPTQRLLMLTSPAAPISLAYNHLLALTDGTTVVGV